MKKHLLISVASAALIGVSSLAFAQAPGGQSQGGASQGGAPSAQQSAPSGGASQAEPSARGDEGASGGKMAPHEGRGDQRAQEQPGGMKSKAVESDVKGGKTANDNKPVQDKSASENGMKGNRNAAESKDSDSKAPNAKAASETKSDSKAGATTGQAGAGAKQLTSEQRTTVRTSISKQGIKPVTNVNFSISVGTRVPRGVGFHPLPVEIVTIYPDYRGYEFILVGDQIIVVNPRTLEIVAVLEA